VTEVGALSAAGWACTLHGKQASVAGWAQGVGAGRSSYMPCAVSICELVS